MNSPTPFKHKQLTLLVGIIFYLRPAFGFREAREDRMRLRKLRSNANTFLGANYFNDETMKKLVNTLLVGLTILIHDGICQKGPARYFGEPILTDSLSTLLIPTRYNEEFLSFNKIAFWGDYYANMVAYNFQTDTYKKVFDKDTFIESVRSINDSYGTRTADQIKNLTKKWIFLLVKPKDTNSSGRIDERDPSVLFAVSVDGQIVKQVTDGTESVVSFYNYEKQGFLLIKIQRDSDNDRSFKSEDKVFYFRKVNLTDLVVGNGIELK